MAMGSVGNFTAGVGVALGGFVGVASPVPGDGGVGAAGSGADEEEPLQPVKRINQSKQAECAKPPPRLELFSLIELPYS